MKSMASAVRGSDFANPSCGLIPSMSFCRGASSPFPAWKASSGQWPNSGNSRTAIGSRNAARSGSTRTRVMRSKAGLCVTWLSMTRSLLRSLTRRSRRRAHRSGTCVVVKSASTDMANNGIERRPKGRWLSRRDKTCRHRRIIQFRPGYRFGSATGFRPSWFLQVFLCWLPGFGCPDARENLACFNREDAQMRPDRFCYLLAVILAFMSLISLSMDSREINGSATKGGDANKFCYGNQVPFWQHPCKCPTININQFCEKGIPPEDGSVTVPVSACFSCDGKSCTDNPPAISCSTPDANGNTFVWSCGSNRCDGTGSL